MASLFEPRSSGPPIFGLCCIKEQPVVSGLSKFRGFHQAAEEQ
jgi:hypothetical protein